MRDYVVIIMSRNSLCYHDNGFSLFCNETRLNVCACTHTYTHIHTETYIYIYIERERVTLCFKYK